MKLQKLLDVGAFTVAGDVILYVAEKHRQIKIADWNGGEDVALTVAGKEMLLNGAFNSPEAPVEIPSFEPPRRRGKKAEPTEVSDDPDLSTFKLDGE